MDPCEVLPSQEVDFMRTAILISLFATGLILAVNMSSEASGQATVSGGSWSFPAGSTGNQVEIKVTGLPAAGLGASDVTIAFDSSVLEVTACTTGDMAGACNPNAPAGPARAAGFAIFPITSEPVVIARVTFDCVGTPDSSTALTLTADELVDGDLAPIPHSFQHGNVICLAPPTATPAPAPTLVLSPTPVATLAPTATASPAQTTSPGPTDTATPTPGPTDEPGKPQNGDVDCSGEVNPIDSLKILRFDAGLHVGQEDGCPEIGS